MPPSQWKQVSLLGCCLASLFLIGPLLSCSELCYPTPRPSRHSLSVFSLWGLNYKAAPQRPRHLRFGWGTPSKLRWSFWGIFSLVFPARNCRDHFLFLLRWNAKPRSPPNCQTRRPRDRSYRWSPPGHSCPANTHSPNYSPHHFLLWKCKYFQGYTAANMRHFV